MTIRILKKSPFEALETNRYPVNMDNNRRDRFPREISKNIYPSDKNATYPKQCHPSPCQKFSSSLLLSAQSRWELTSQQAAAYDS